MDDGNGGAEADAREAQPRRQRTAFSAWGSSCHIRAMIRVTSGSAMPGLSCLMNFRRSVCRGGCKRYRSEAAGA